MNYEIRQFDTSLLRFSATEDTSYSDDLSSTESLKAYADTLFPCVYDDYVGTAKHVLTTKHKEGLRHLITFHFKKHPRYNLSNERLRLIEKVISQRAKELLSE